ncbi:MAG: hypothetical protein HC842_00205 [Cytophagales bacterium]|nr:hypothetical protein [Cytophagales bacterium]
MSLMLCCLGTPGCGWLAPNRLEHPLSAWATEWSQAGVGPLTWAQTWTTDTRQGDELQILLDSLGPAEAVCWLSRATPYDSLRPSAYPARCGCAANLTKPLC